MARPFACGIRKRLVSVALSFTVILSLSPATLAEQPTPAPTAVYYTDYNNNTADNNKKIYLGLFNDMQPQSAQANDLYALKKLLYENGYYEAVGVSNNEISWQSNALDEITLNALREYCLRNDISEYDSQLGLTYGAWWHIQGGEFINLNAPEGDDGEYSEILWGKGSESLSKIVDRLYELGFLENRTHEVYDNEIRDALEEFGKNNGLQDYYANDSGDAVRPINADIQRVLFSNDASAKPTPKKGGPSDYFVRTVDVAGLKIPMLALWGIALAVLVACILVAIYFFMPSESKKGGKKKKQNLVHFDISYNGKTQRTEAEIVKTLKIGRGVGNFPLDLSDMQISRRHCELYYLNGSLMLRDYSANGTLVNGKPVHNAEEILKSGDVLMIGEHSITITC